MIVAEAPEPAPARGHHDIPPKAHTWQSDVEPVHRLQEDEFFDRESVAGRAEFWVKVTTYWRHFNIARPNRNQQWKTPLQILRQRNPKLDLAIASWRPLDLAAELRQYFPSYPPKRGHNLPVHPCPGTAPQTRWFGWIQVEQSQ